MKVDSAIEKLGVYDFFCAFISGLLFVFMCIYIGIPYQYLLLQTDDGTINLIAFLLLSYICGQILQEIGSFIDRKTKIIDFRYQVSTSFIEKEYTLFDNEYEKILIKEMCEDILDKKKRIKHDFAEERSYFVYQHCKTYLETKGKDSKIERINSAYGMSRSVMIACALSTIIHSILYYLQYYLPRMVPNFVPFVLTGYECTTSRFLITLVALLLTGFVFMNRAVRYAKYRVRVVLRQYNSYVHNVDS